MHNDGSNKATLWWKPIRIRWSPSKCWSRPPQISRTKPKSGGSQPRSGRACPNVGRTPYTSSRTKPTIGGSRTKSGRTHTSDGQPSQCWWSPKRIWSKQPASLPQQDQHQSRKEPRPNREKTKLRGNVPTRAEEAPRASKRGTAARGSDKLHVKGERAEHASGKLERMGYGDQRRGRARRGDERRGRGPEGTTEKAKGEVGSRCRPNADGIACAVRACRSWCVAKSSATLTPPRPMICSAMARSCMQMLDNAPRHARCSGKVSAVSSGEWPLPAKFGDLARGGRRGGHCGLTAPAPAERAALPECPRTRPKARWPYDTAKTGSGPLPPADWGTTAPVKGARGGISRVHYAIVGVSDGGVEPGGRQSRQEFARVWHAAKCPSVPSTTIDDGLHVWSSKDPGQK